MAPILHRGLAGSADLTRRTLDLADRRSNNEDSVRDRPDEADHLMSDDSFVIDPADFISGPYEECPFCQEPDSFGLLSVGRYSYVKRCRSCFEDRKFELPRMSKKMIYLDQHGISHLAKSLHPDSMEKYERDEPATHHGFWSDLFAKLDRLHKLQLAVCPMSGVQRMESLFDSRLSEKLRTVNEHLAGGVRFIDRDSIQGIQMAAALEAFLEDREVELDPSDVINGNLQHWIDKVRISVNMGLEDLERAEAQGLRDRRFRQLTEYRERIEQSPGKTFDGYFSETIDDAPELLNSLGHMAILRRIFDRNDVDQSVREAKLRDFATSSQLREMPMLAVWAALMAAYAVEISQQRASELKTSLYFDFSGISTYMPYCDGIFVDRECARLLEMAREAGVDLGSARVFTIDQKQEFLEYLDDIENQAPTDHVELVEKVYGPSWLTPFWKIYTWRDEPDGED